MVGQLCSLFTRTALANIRRKCLRRGFWFKALGKMERGIVELTIKCLEVVRSKMLAITLARILVKLEAALHQFTLTIMSIGRRLAEINSKAASSWGNVDAFKWKYDVAYVRCLGLNALSSGFNLMV